MGVAVTKMQGAVPERALEYAVDIVGLAKRFERKTLARGGYTTIKSKLLSLISGSKPAEPRALTTWAVKDLTMRVPRGASLGVIGRNGSGKSTLLKLISGIYKPTAGRVAVNGRVAALIELGAGFHPDFSGRENLYLGGAMHGLTRRQLDERIETIIDFAELRDFIDDPVRTYSSGMFMRLGFSLAVHTDPDILIVDEVLAVGDAGFVSKCKERISELRAAGKTLFLVTHDLEAVERWCDEVVWIHGGKIQDRGDPRRVIDAYRSFIERGEEQSLFSDREAQAEATSDRATEVTAAADHAQVGSVCATQRWGSREVEITSISMRDSSGASHLLFHPDSEVTVEINYRVHELPRGKVVFGIGIHRTDGIAVHGSNTLLEKIEVPPLGPAGTVSYRIARLGLLEGNFLLDFAVHRDDGYPYDYHKNAIQFAVRNPINQVGIVSFAHQWSFAAK